MLVVTVKANSTAWCALAQLCYSPQEASIVAAHAALHHAARISAVLRVRPSEVSQAHKALQQATES